MKDRVISVLKRMSGAEEVEMRDILQNDLGFDSMMMVTLLLEIENEFGIELKEEDMNPYDLIFVRDVVKLIKKYEEE